jgi:hypothetical protein
VDPELKSLLQNIEYGDFEDIPKLAEWLKSQGDPRAELAQDATVLGPQEIAEELFKVRWLRRIRESSPNRATSRLRPSTEECLQDVEKALQTRVLPTEIARAMTIARRVKADRLLALFQPSDQATVSRPPS